MSLYTKKALAESLKKLMLESNLDKITINELTTECGVNRQTFYYHFHDIYDLVKWIFQTEAIDPIESFVSYADWQESYLKIFDYVGQNKAFCKNCIESSGRDYLEQFLYRITYGLLITVIEDIAQEKTINSTTENFIANFYSYGLIGIMLTWIREGFKENPQTIVAELNRLVEGDIRKVIESNLNSQE